MIYKAKPQSSFLHFMLVLGIVKVISTNGLTVMNVMIIIGIVAIFCLHYKFQINGNSIRYQIFLLSIPIYKKEIVPEQITEIKFIRVIGLKKVQFFVHFGYDYYMYIGASKDCTEAKEVVKETGLFIESCLAEILKPINMTVFRWRTEDVESYVVIDNQLADELFPQRLNEMDGESLKDYLESNRCYLIFVDLKIFPIKGTIQNIEYITNENDTRTRLSVW